MQKKILGTCFRFFLKLIFVFGAFAFFISGIWGRRISLDSFDHVFRCFTILCLTAGLSSLCINKTGKTSWKLLILVIAACVAGVVGGHLLYVHVLRKVVVFLGKVLGGLLIICLGLSTAILPAMSAAATVAQLGSLGASTVESLIRSGSIRLDDSLQDSFIKDELDIQLGIKYDNVTPFDKK